MEDFERHGCAAGPIERGELVEAVVHDARRPVFLDQVGIGAERLLAFRRAEGGLAVLHVGAAHIVQEDAERVGQCRLQPACREGRHGGIAGLDLVGHLGDVVDRRRRRDLAFREDVGAIIEQRPLDIERDPGEDAVERRGLDERRAQIAEIVVRRDVFLRQRRQVRVPARGGELLSFARGQRHEDVGLVAMRVQHRQQPLAHLLLLIGVHLQLDAGQFLEIVLVFQDRRRDRIVVGKERDRRALVGLPVEVGRIGRHRGRARERQGEAQRSRPTRIRYSDFGCRRHDLPPWPFASDRILRSDSIDL